MTDVPLKCESCGNLVDREEGEYLNFTDKGMTFYCNDCFTAYWDMIEEEEARELGEN